MPLGHGRLRAAAATLCTHARPPGLRRAAAPTRVGLAALPLSRGAAAAPWPALADPRRGCPLRRACARATSAPAWEGEARREGTPGLVGMRAGAGPRPLTLEPALGPARLAPWRGSGDRRPEQHKHGGGRRETVDEGERKRWVRERKGGSG
ncbi:hypothetical protein C2845_PM15G22120 [Panicum miliaceum]|uniref:Uncharacterized protein n=1 Tax=Panicum miliaceum TaxID=4540 RepID=A0A3L6Q9K8_PANMI|nr:hypothetical protein C2845_PM15G22120 [Panicum miliaceum]